MVQVLSTNFTYNYDFPTTSAAYLNRYPNPFAKHVLSSDTLNTHVDLGGRLHTTRLVVKTGLLPDFIKPFLGRSVQSWIIERSIIDPKLQTLQAYSSNLDHHRIVKIEELLTYRCSRNQTRLECNVRFLSNLFGFKRRIEAWTKEKFSKNLPNLIQGFMYVIEKVSRLGSRLLNTPSLRDRTIWTVVIWRLDSWRNQSIRLMYFTTRKECRHEKRRCCCIL